MRATWRRQVRENSLSSLPVPRARQVRTAVLSQPTPCDEPDRYAAQPFPRRWVREADLSRPAELQAGRFPLALDARRPVLAKRPSSLGHHARTADEAPRRIARSTPRLRPLRASSHLAVVAAACTGTSLASSRGPGWLRVRASLSQAVAVLLKGSVRCQAGPAISAPHGTAVRAATSICEVESCPALMFLRVSCRCAGCRGDVSP